MGTAGIRGTIPRMKVVKLPNGGFNQTTQMLKGKISYMPKGGGRPTMLGPGQSLASGISATGLVLPIQIGRVPTATATRDEGHPGRGRSGKCGNGSKETLAVEGPPPMKQVGNQPRRGRSFG